MKNLCSPFLLLLGVGLFIVWMSQYDRAFYIAVFFVFGIVRLMSFSVWHQEQQLVPKEVAVVTGTIQQVKETPYAVQAVLKPTSCIVGKERVRINQSNKVQLIFPPNTTVEEGDQVAARGTIEPHTKQMNPSDLDYRTYLQANRIIGRIAVDDYKLEQGHKKLTTRIVGEMKIRLQQLLGGKDQGVIQTILLGDDGFLDGEVERLYQQVGIAHLLAISGFHVATVAGILLVMMRMIGVSYNMRQWVVLGGVWLYYLLTGGSISSLRATIFVSCFLLASIVWEESDRLTSLAISAGIILWLNPLQITQVGFLLSFGAVLGILMGMHINELSVSRDTNQSMRQRKMVKGIYIYIGMYMFTAPIIAFFFYVVPFTSNLLNLLVVPLFSLLIPLCFFMIGSSFVWFPLAKVVANIVIGILYVIEWLAKVAITFPLGRVVIGRPSPIALLLYIVLVVGILGVIIIVKQSYKKIGYIGSILTTAILISCLPSNRLELMQVYVGQGDAAVWRLPNGKVCLMDMGVYEKGKVVERFLYAKGISRIDTAFVSHLDEDHSGGLFYLLEKDIPIKQIIVPYYPEDKELLHGLVDKADAKDIPVYAMKKGDTIQLGNITVDCLWPEEEQLVADRNDASLVCRLSYGDFSALYTGDISKVVESYMAEELAPVTLLKVAHHGSKTATSQDFLLKIQPRYGMISCGINNRYQHPHDDTMEQLETVATETYRTDRVGAINVVTNGKSIVVSTHLGKEE